ncbi:hypothetical protein CY652_13215 [Burkholderia sp. WAC0059]|uniref:hypothetical protein n=1 Tax=Burkholderia sp. WAC0059 TaxID=2066022 RepID=UPI000C7EC66C|nr:hypothetical protein [Burkholderia sp. WAC0059]PLZ01983.1 hypothetical protein CY652_13215 [Burkholderia sp. WAC0059]
MEKILVVTGIWTMCALCAVLFVRGAVGRPAEAEFSRRRAPAAQPVVSYEVYDAHEVREDRADRVGEKL